MKNFNMMFLALVTVAGLHAQVQSPCSAPQFRDFDFWIGEWVVHDSTGQEVGQNTITPVEGGCALTERWVGASGTTGRSINYYSKSDSSWHQLWVDNSGTILNLKGQGGEGEMALRSEMQTGSNGKDFVHEIEWSLMDDGRVQQHWQVEFLDGSPPTTLFLGFYSKK
jgi:hypothetical protein